MDRTSAINKLLALSEVTVENGSTQPEQDTAMRLAERLIERHAISYDEVAQAFAVRSAQRAPPPPVQPVGFPGHVHPGNPGFVYGYGTGTNNVAWNGIRIVFG